jgi:hypothetical protein
MRSALAVSEAREAGAPNPKPATAQSFFCSAVSLTLTSSSDPSELHWLHLIAKGPKSNGFAESARESLKERAMQEGTVSSHCQAPDERTISTDVLIIGFGLSAIPLIRELERDNINYAVVSNGDGSIWDRLEKHGRLDFDLVSSMHSSLYSFELVNREAKDRYPTSKEFFAFIRKYLTQYSSKVLKDFVISVANYSSKSVIHTRSGRIFETKHLVIASGLKRRMNELLNQFDYAAVTNKTIAFTAMGDSANLMIAKLIPYNNRIVLITNGFFLLDKLVFYGGIPYTLDQLEYHNIRHLSYSLYRKTLMPGLDFALFCQKWLKFLPINHIYFKHPLAIRRISRKLSLRYFAPHSPIPNGIIAIKYWPIDAYQQLFDNDALKQSIRDGYLLNDIAFFLEHGLVELWPKQETVIDREQSTIQWKDKVLRYDHIVDGDYEVPNLPEIVLGEGSLKRKYEYDCRNNFMGMIPKELRNVYFIGFMRPTTGGLNNITEMQCLLTHKMITDLRFNNEIYGNLEKRIENYNKHYYPSEERTPADHLVPYGFYTDDIAQLLKIDSRLSDCRSLRDLMIHYFFPNAAFKFRQSGPYKVEGTKEMVQQIYKDHMGFSLLIGYLLTYALLQLTAYAAVIAAYYQQWIPVVALPFLLLAVLLNPVTPFVAGWLAHNSLLNFIILGVLNVIMIVALGLTALHKNASVPIAVLLAAFTLTYTFHRLGWSRAPFHDLSNKKSPKFRDFFKRYCAAFREAFSER